MLYERITKIELEALTIDGVHSPIYGYEEFIVVPTEEDPYDGYYVNLTIIKTAEEVYEEAQQPQAISKRPRTMEELEQENKQLWDCVESIYKELGYIPEQVSGGGN